MLEKQLLLKDLQEKLQNAESEEVKILLNELIGNISDGSKYAPRIW